MKKFLIATLTLVIGFIVGLYTAIAIFPIDVDILGLPYSNTTVKLDRDLHVTQGELRIEIPKGSQLEYEYSIKSVPIYSLKIVGELGEPFPKVTDDNDNYFFSRELVSVKASDCGPLARGELGVVFSADRDSGRQVYFVEGVAGHICPELMSVESVVGYESNYCDKYEPLNPNECDSIKTFTITAFNSLQE